MPAVDPIRQREPDRANRDPAPVRRPASVRASSVGRRRCRKLARHATRPAQVAAALLLRWRAISPRCAGAIRNARVSVVNPLAPTPSVIAPNNDSNGKATGSSRRARRGAGCWLRTTMAPPAGRRYRAAGLRGGGRRRPVVLSQGAHARMDVPVGEGSARPRSGRYQETFDRGRRFALAFARGCGRRHAPGRRARVSSRASVRSLELGDVRSDGRKGAMRCWCGHDRDSLWMHGIWPTVEAAAQHGRARSSSVGASCPAGRR